MPRLILIEESLHPRPEPPGWGVETRRFNAELDDGTKITVVESTVDHADVFAIAHQVAGVLLDHRYYGHIWIDPDHLCVAFPHCVVDLERGDYAAAELARHVGHRFGIPDSEMRWEDMFDDDHPDLP